MGWHGQNKILIFISKTHYIYICSVYLKIQRITKNNLLWTKKSFINMYMEDLPSNIKSTNEYRSHIIESTF